MNSRVAAANCCRYKVHVCQVQICVKNGRQFRSYKINCTATNLPPVVQQQNDYHLQLHKEKVWGLDATSRSDSRRFATSFFTVKLSPFLAAAPVKLSPQAARSQLQISVCSCKGALCGDNILLLHYRTVAAITK